MSKRLTVLIGAGATIEIGGPTTSDITKKVRRKKQGFFNERKSYFIDRVAKVLDSHYKEPVNFEEIYHTLELISSYEKGWIGASKEHTPYMTPFLKPRFNRFFDHVMLSNAKRDLIDTVASIVYNYDSQYSPEKFSWHHRFWNTIMDNYKLDIATLNYDTCIEKSLSNLEDGFEKTQYNFKRFSPKKLSRSNKSKIYHLHGCINYGFERAKNPNEYSLEDDFNDLYKFNSFKDASMTWSGRSGNTSQSSEEASIGPIITGLKKTDKIINFPYSSYFNALHNAIICNNALLIIGYSFGDTHFNRLLERIVRIHRDKRRIAVISYHDGPWHRDWQVMDWPEERDMVVFASKAFQDYSPFENGEGEFLKSPEVLRSKDGCARIYLRGFKHTVENHLDDLVRFLRS